jgi:predicted anti-sigma-YlaC factor YlaD
VIQPVIRCAELVELVTEWMEGALDEVTAGGFEEHLVLCPSCSAYVAQVRQAIEVSGDLGADDAAPPPAARAALLAMFRAEHGR